MHEVITTLEYLRRMLGSPHTHILKQQQQQKQLYENYNRNLMLLIMPTHNQLQMLRLARLFDQIIH